MIRETSKQETNVYYIFDMYYISLTESIEITAGKAKERNDYIKTKYDIYCALTEEPLFIMIVKRQ